MKKLFALFSILASLIVLAGSATAQLHRVAGKGDINTVKTYADEKADAFEEYISEGNYFRCLLPKGWGKMDTTFGMSQAEEKVYGVNVFGPSTSDNLAVMISVHYYGKDNIIHETAEEFIEIHSKPILGLEMEGEKYGPVVDAKVAGLPAKTFERHKFDFVGDRFNYKKIPMIERFIVIPAREGFYVLSYEAPAESAEEYRSVFEKVTGSFEPHLK